METITITQTEYFKMQQKIEELEKKISLLQDEKFIEKINLAWQIFVFPKYLNQNNEEPKISIKRGSGKQFITYIADDFTAPLNDFNDYM